MKRPLPIYWTTHAHQRMYERFGNAFNRLPSKAIAHFGAQCEVGNFYSLSYGRARYICKRLARKAIIVTVIPLL